MVQVLSPLHPLALKPRPSNFRCSPVTRRTFPSTRDLAFSQAKHRTALERVALHKFAVLPSPLSSLPKHEPPSSTVISATSFTPFSAPVSAPATPPTPLEAGQDLRPEPKLKTDIFKNTTKSDELLDLTLAALHRIYIEDSTPDLSLYQPQHSQTMPHPTVEALRSGLGAYKHCYEQSPPLSCGSSVPSPVSPLSVPTPQSLSPGFVEPEIACPNEATTATARVYCTAPRAYPTIAAKASQPIARTQSLPSNYQYFPQSRAVAPHPVMEDKSLRWFLTELLRRSRASASVVQLALHYLTQAREPVGKILAQKFKTMSNARTSGDGYAPISDSGEDKEDSPLLDPRRLLLASLMLSTKILYDHAPNNRAWARVCGLGSRDVNACERALGEALDWKLAHMFVGPLDCSAIFG